MKQSNRSLALILSMVLLISALCACGRSKEEPKATESASPTESAEAAESASPAESTAAPEAAAASERQDGERFEGTIVLEGMEETIPLEHVVNVSAGFAMDYDYESFVRSSEPDRERIVWGYDDPQNPENYLEVSRSTEDAQTAADTVSETLSEKYEIVRDTVTLDGAGECIRIDASEVKGGGNTADVLQEVYIIPAADGCLVAAIRYIPEGSDGFGMRLAYMVNTITVMESQIQS